MLLRDAVIEQAAAKVGIFGLQGSGKSTTAALIAIGLAKTYHGSAPVAFMDTENGSDYLVPIFQAEGVPLKNFKSRSFADMCAGIKEAKDAGCCLYLVDSYTHPWTELQDTLKKKLKVTELEFRHQDELKSIWRGWTDLMLNSPLHVIVSGRLGWQWDREEREDGKRELVKVGSKMKSENEAGYEPSLLIEMEAVQDERMRMQRTRTRKGSITHNATVLKDRWRALNGRTFQWSDINEYKPGGYKKVFDSFQPHFSKLAIGVQQRAVDSSRTSAALFDNRGNSQYQQRAREVQIAIETMWELFARIWPGQDAQTKELKRTALETIHNTLSKTAVEAKPLEELQFGVRLLEQFEFAAKQDPRMLTDKAILVFTLEHLKAAPSPEEDDAFGPAKETTVLLEGMQVR